MVLRRLEVLPDDHHPAFVVWELTLRCDQPCKHCGSRAGAARPDELGRDEVLDVVRQLSALRTREVTLIGGEAYLHPAFLDVVAALKAAGIRPSMVTGGRGITPELARAMAAAGMHTVSVSIDGLEETHDRVRVSGGFRAALRALAMLKGEGIHVGANTCVQRLNMGELDGLYDVLRGAGIRGWQVQVTIPLGRAADRPDLLLQPWDLLAVVPRIAAIKERAFRDGILVMPGNNLGYFGPEEALLRSPEKGGTDHWLGCQAGRFVLGIESNGNLKGCLSLQSGPYVAASVRDGPLAETWAKAGGLHFMRTRTVDDLWGFCRSCAFAAACLAGCTFAAHGLCGRPGNNPYCHYRARTLARDGKRERLVLRASAPGVSFDNAVFDLVVEPLGAPDPRPERAEGMLHVCRQ